MSGAALGLAVAANRQIGLKVYNPRGLRRWKAAYDGCLYAPAYIHAAGDSLWESVGTTGSATSTLDMAAADYNGQLGQLRTRFARHLGTAEAGFIAARCGGSPNDSDTRRSKVGGSAASSTGPIFTGWNVPNTNTVTFTLPTCTAFDILTYQSTSTPVTGKFSYTVDGGGAVEIARTDNKFTVNKVTGLSAATHTVVITGTDATFGGAILFGIRYHSGAGVCVARFAQAGWTLMDSFGLGANNDLSANAAGQERNAQGYGAWAPDLTLIGFLHNDWANQPTSSNPTPYPSGVYSNLANYRTYLQNAVDRVVAAGGCSLLVAPQAPPTQTVPNEVYPISAYRDVMKSIALSTDHCACIDINERVGSVAEALAIGYHYNNNTVHGSIRGYGINSATLFNVLTRPSIVGA